MKNRPESTRRFKPRRARLHANPYTDTESMPKGARGASLWIRGPILSTLQTATRANDTTSHRNGASVAVEKEVNKGWMGDKLMAGASPTSRTKDRLRKQGIVSGVVERFNPHVGEHGIRQDLFGIIDVIATDHSRGVIGIQCCSGSGLSSHWKKLTVEKYLATLNWLRTPGAHLEIWAWRKLKVKRGGKAVRWEPKIVTVTFKDIKGKRQWPSTRRSSTGRS